MGAGSEELSLTEMSIETSTRQRDNTNSKRTVGSESLEQRSPVGNEWIDTIHTPPLLGSSIMVGDRQYNSKAVGLRTEMVKIK